MKLKISDFIGTADLNIRLALRTPEGREHTRAMIAVMEDLTEIRNFLTGHPEFDQVIKEEVNLNG